MPKHKSDDYKLSAVHYFIKNKSLRKTCILFSCSKSSLQRWVERYLETDLVSGKSNKVRKTIVTNKILDFIEKQIINNPTIILRRLKKLTDKHFNVKISTTYMYYIIKYKLKYSTKQLRKKYYPEKKLTTLKKDKLNFYRNIIKIGIKNIISIDESSFYLNMTRNFGKSKIGKRVYHKTNIYPFKRYNFICAIKHDKIVGFRLYEKLKGGIKFDELNRFIDDFIKNRYTGNYILMDNAVTHRTKILQKKILDTKNNFIYALPYKPNTNPVEGLFSQIKNYVRQDNPITYRELNTSIKNTIKKYVKRKHLKNYFKVFSMNAVEFVKNNKQ